MTAALVTLCLTTSAPVRPNVVDYALDFMTAARGENKPFFLYLAFNAPHFPLHARPDDIAKYKDTYTPASRPAANSASSRGT